VSDSEFYVGYFPQVGPGLGRFLRGRIVALLVIGAAVAVGLALVAPPLGTGVFEYGTIRDFDGRVIESPYPMLAVARPGFAAPAWSYYLLVGRGKHGAAPDVRGMDGKSVRLTGSLIYREGSTMIEVTAPPEEAGETGAPLDPMRYLGDLTLTGEIVDGKCNLGVMNPGEGPTHRGCAVQCIRGGEPPLLVAKDSAGTSWRFLLTDQAGDAVGMRLLDLVAVPVKVTGRVFRRGDLLYLAVEPSTIERL
jgi:hypothetical protein